jgi:hypothetical protein
MRGFKYLILFAFISCLFISGCSKDPIHDVEIVRTSFTIMQLPTQVGSIMNSYIILTRNGKVVVIDGGCIWDAGYLYKVLKYKCGNHVDAWIISHTHSDHVDALTAILSTPRYYNDLIIDTVYASLLSETEVSIYENNSLATLKNFLEAINSSNQPLIDLKLGRKIHIDGVDFKILGIKNPEIHRNFVNNSSVVVRVSNSEKSALFLGDIGEEAGNKIMGLQSNMLKSDFVQMSHHGFGGVSKRFYEAVNPKYCLWPTPQWLWKRATSNPPSSVWDEITYVKGWMDDLKVERHFVMADGFLQAY